MLGEAPIPGRDSLDFTQIAESFPFSGGRIRNAFVDACLRASVAGAISQDLLLASCQEEQKSALASPALRTIHGFAAHERNSV